MKIEASLDTTDLNATGDNDASAVIGDVSTISGVSSGGKKKGKKVKKKKKVTKISKNKE